MRSDPSLNEYDSSAVKTPLFIRPLVTAVIIFVTSYALPESTFFLSRWNQAYLKPLAQRFVFVTGLWQHWQMYVEFSTTWSETTWEIARELPDGRLESLGWPMMRRLSAKEALLAHKYRKFVEVANQGYLGERLPKRACRFFAQNASFGERVVLIKERRLIFDSETGAAETSRSVVAECRGRGGESLR